MNMVVLEVRSLAEMLADAARAMKSRRADREARISFATLELLWQVLTAKRWELLKAMCGAGPISIREAARRVGRDVKAVHGDAMALLNAGAPLPHVRSGAFKAYAVSAKRRLAAAPGIPTVEEAGFPNLYATVWFGFWAPARTPKDIIAKLNAAAVDALADPNVRARLANLAQDIFPREQQTPAALAALQKAEIEKWWPIIKGASIKAG